SAHPIVSRQGSGSTERIERKLPDELFRSGRIPGATEHPGHHSDRIGNVGSEGIRLFRKGPRFIQLSAQQMKRGQESERWRHVGVEFQNLAKPPRSFLVASSRNQ